MVDVGITTCAMPTTLAMRTHASSTTPTTAATRCVVAAFLLLTVIFLIMIIPPVCVPIGTVHVTTTTIVLVA